MWNLTPAQRDHSTGSAPTKNQALAALPHFFDALVQRHLAALNPLVSVHGVRHQNVIGHLLGLGVEW
jgi:hypothetical protein